MDMKSKFKGLVEELMCDIGASSIVALLDGVATAGNGNWRGISLPYYDLAVGAGYVAGYKVKDGKIPYTSLAMYALSVADDLAMCIPSQNYLMLGTRMLTKALAYGGGAVLGTLSNIIRNEDYS